LDATLSAIFCHPGQWQPEVRENYPTLIARRRTNVPVAADGIGVLANKKGCINIILGIC